MNPSAFFMNHSRRHLVLLTYQRINSTNRARWTSCGYISRAYVKCNTQNVHDSGIVCFVLVFAVPGCYNDL